MLDKDFCFQTANSFRLSRRFDVLASDSQLWKAAYYNRFVRPRASRIPGIREADVPAASLHYSSRISKWLDDDHLVRKGRKTDWKRQYKLRHNWSRGSCDVREIQIAARPSVPPLSVRLHEDTVITADASHGLRAWTMRPQQQLLATLALEATNSSAIAPTSLAIDVSKNDKDNVNISVGFADGRFGIYLFHKGYRILSRNYLHAPSSNGIVSSIAYASPYLLTMTKAQLLSLYRFPIEQEDESIKSPPQLLSSLKSHTAWPPLSLSIRATRSNIVASIAYALPTYLSGWSVGLQELHLTDKGKVVRSRLASATDQGFTPLSSLSSHVSSPSSNPSSSPPEDCSSRRAPSLTRPTSLSYSHPYLLASHADNTLTLYLISSTEVDLSIGKGNRLWGHTSSVSGAHIGDRGKAVSVSLHGNEIRVWELEGGFPSGSSRRRAATSDASVQVQPEKKASAAIGSDIVGRGVELKEDLEITTGFVGFDEESVLVLREKGEGSQALVVYDFS